jgi:very-short-patch-repair endonuclease
MREENARTGQAVAELASRQHGVAADWQLRATGLSSSAISRRVASGWLHRMHQGVYAVGHRGGSIHATWMAAVLACGKASRLNPGAKAIEADEMGSTMTVLDYWGAALSHLSAAALWELSPPRDGPVDVAIRGYGGRAKRVGVRLHRSRLLLPASVTLRIGIPVTTPARTIADLRRVSTGRAPLTSPKELRRTIRQANFLGLPVGDEERRDRNRSDLEEDFQRLCRKRGLLAPEVNVRVGPHLVDFLWRDRSLVVETDGYVSHRGRVAVEDDRGRDLDLRARGFEVIRLTEKQVDDEADRVVEVVGAALRVRADAV